MPVPVPPLMRRFLRAQDVIFEAIGERAVEHSRADEVFHLEAPGRELADGERDASQAARRDDGGDAAAIREARIENGLCLRDVIAQTPRDILHGDHERLLPERDAFDLLQEAALFDEHLVGTVDHDFADRVVENQVLDGLEERQDHLESAHRRCVYFRCS